MGRVVARSDEEQPARQRAAPIYYAAVAGDVRRTFHFWADGKADPSETASTYSGMFFDLCRELDRPGVVSFPSSDPGVEERNNIRLHPRPAKTLGSGWRYHAGMIRAGVRLWSDIRKSGARDAIIMDGVTYLFLMLPLTLGGVRIYTSIHTVLWGDRPPSAARRIILRLEGWFLRRHCAGVLAVSDRILEQVRTLANGRPPPMRRFIPQYCEADFARFANRDLADKPLRVLFMGRVEANKGVFDLLQVARSLKNKGLEVIFELLGDGSALPLLKAMTEEEKLTESFVLHGHCDRTKVVERLEDAHIVIVPTRSDFPEGLNKVVLEAILARRPVITSKVCPAADLVPDAVVLAPVDLAKGYEDAIVALGSNASLYREKVEQAEKYRPLFFDPKNSWLSAAQALLTGQLSTKQRTPAGPR